MRKLLLLIFNFVIIFNAQSQNISGTLSQLPNQSIRLEAFNGFKTYQVSSATTDEQGNFKLNYAITDYGLGYLISADNKPFFVILSGEDIELKGEALSLTESLKTLKGKENIAFARYAAEHPRHHRSWPRAGGVSGHAAGSGQSCRKCRTACPRRCAGG